MLQYVAERAIQQRRQQEETNRQRWSEASKFFDQATVRSAQDQVSFDWKLAFMGGSAIAGRGAAG